jgi:hypothetical protein
LQTSSPPSIFIMVGLVSHRRMIALTCSEHDQITQCKPLSHQSTSRFKLLPLKDLSRFDAVGLTNAEAAERSVVARCARILSVLARSLAGALERSQVLSIQLQTNPPLGRSAPVRGQSRRVFESPPHYFFMRRSRILTSGLNGAWIGLAFGVLAMVYVTAVRLLLPEALERLGIPFWRLALLYLAVAPGLGFLGGAMRTWLTGRLGSTIIATGLGAAATAIVLPLLPNTSTPWGPVEYLTIVLLAVMSGIFIGARHR